MPDKLRWFCCLDSNGLKAIVMDTVVPVMGSGTWDSEHGDYLDFGPTVRDLWPKIDIPPGTYREVHPPHRLRVKQ